MADRLTRSAKPTRHEMKEDPLVTWAFQAQDWVQNNLKIVGGVLAAIVVAAVAGLFISRANQRANAEANSTIAEASVHYWQGNYVRTIQLTDQVLSTFGQTSAANDARRLKADALFWQGAFDSSAMLYKTYLSKHPQDDPLRRAVQMSLAFALESNKDYAGAGKLYEELATKAPDRSTTADLLIAAARSYREAKQPDKSKALYEKVANDYKDTTYARDAEVALGELLAQAK